MQKDLNLALFADAVLDGQPLDWQALESTADPEARRLLREFHTIAEIAGICRQVAPPPGVATDSWPETFQTNPIASPDAPPATWGALRILERIGHGRFGDVYRAWDPNLDREVALKLLRHRDAPEGEEQRVVEEGRLMARVRHPNVVAIYGAQRIDGRTGLWMEFVRGRTLEAELRERGPFPCDEVVQIGIQLCRALAAVHEAALVHRDVKAQNVMRDTRQRVVIGDFGTGRGMDSDSSAGDMAGTPAYLAPEIFERVPATPQSDLYSLGTLLFHLLTGGYPVSGGTIRELRQAHREGKRASLRSWRSDVPNRLARAIECALDPDPDRRFASAAEMERALAAPLVQRIRFPYIAAAAIVIVLLTSSILAWRKWGTQPDMQPPRSAAVLTDPADSVAPDSGPSQASIQVSVPAPVSAAAISSSSPTATTLTFQRVDPSGTFNFRSLTDDGKHALCTPFAGSIEICDLTAKSIRQLRTGGNGGHAVLSPDGSRVAYFWNDVPGPPVPSGPAMRLMAADGSGDREIYRPPAGATFGDFRWIRDGQALLFHVSNGQGKGAGLVALSVDSGEQETLWQFDRPNVVGQLSPDERYIVFSRTAPDQPTADLAIIDRQTGQESWLLVQAANDRNPMWTPDGSAVVFVSDPFGSIGLYALPIQEGRAIGAPVVLRDFGRGLVELLNFGRDGTLLLRMVTHWIDAYRATVNLETGGISLPFRLDMNSIEETSTPDWNPDGRLIAYLSGRPLSPQGKARVVVRHADGRLVQEIPLRRGIGRAARLRWSPDGRTFAVRYNEEGAQTELDLIDIQTEEARTLMRGVHGSFVWDNSTGIYYSRDRRILRYDLASGASTAVLEPGGLYSGGPFDVSPSDGKIVFVQPVPVGAGGGGGGRGAGVQVACEVHVFDPRTGRSSIRHRFAPPASCYSVAWSRDGRKLLVGMIQPDELWVMDPVEGAPLPVMAGTESINSLSVAPGNRELLFSAGNPKPEFWTLSGIRSLLSDRAGTPEPPAKQKK